MSQIEVEGGLLGPDDGIGRVWQSRVLDWKVCCTDVTVVMVDVPHTVFSVTTLHFTG